MRDVNIYLGGQSVTEHSRYSTLHTANFGSCHHGNMFSLVTELAYLHASWCEVAKPLRTIEHLLATQNGGAISNALFTIHFMVSNA